MSLDETRTQSDFQRWRYVDLCTTREVVVYLAHFVSNSTTYLEYSTKNDFV
jgi:hypothetical protein